ncbi:MAG: glucose-1-phosphate adenylyltransferase subunit GlgD [Clostridia bacterium]|nr:glucose-1-phosphate adenylyltransferase subunit GlgD [Clostridia bacterium]
MSNTMGIIFSNIHDSDVPELTQSRTLGSIPFCGRYRLVDFALSNMVNSDITKVGVITKSNYQSLMDHIGSGKDWDLARRHGGLRILPPFGVQENTSLYNTRLEALKNIIGFIEKSTEQYVVMTDCDLVCNMDYDKIVRTHIRKNADVTMVYARMNAREMTSSNDIVLKLDASGRVTDISFAPRVQGEVNVFANVFVLNRNLLSNLVKDAISHNKHHFTADIIARNVGTLRVFGYEHASYFAKITSLQSYYDKSMELLDKTRMNEVFLNNNVYTKIRDSAPTKYGDLASVKNSLIADGCVIEGEVENSILFRGVKVARGASVKNSILMQDTIIGDNAYINCIITDKNVTVTDGRHLSGCETNPFYIRKNSKL